MDEFFECSLSKLLLEYDALMNRRLRSSQVEEIKFSRLGDQKFSRLGETIVRLEDTMDEVSWLGDIDKIFPQLKAFIIVENSCSLKESLTLEGSRGVLRKILGYHALYRVAVLLGYLGENEAQDFFNRIQECFVEIKRTFALSPRDLRKEYVAVVVAAVVLLSYVYLYLTRCSGWDGSTAESSGSLYYRDRYISIVLFQGAYVWIKFREVAFTKPVPTGAVRTVVTTSKEGRTKVKYEPRFKPRKENGISFNWIYLGQFETRADAEVVYRIAASCYLYGKCYGTPLDLGDGREFTIIPKFTAEEQTLSGMEKVACVKERVKAVYECYKTEKDARNLSPALPGASLEQELQNRRLQSEVVNQQQQKHDLARQLHHSQVQIQNLQLRVEDLQRQFQDLQEAQQFQVRNLQPRFQLEDLQQQQPGVESLLTDKYPQQSQQGLQEAQQFEVRYLQLQFQLQHLQQQQPGVESLLTYEDPQQLQQGLQGDQQFQVRNLQPQLQLPDLQQQQPEAESLWTYEYPQQLQQGLQGAQQFQVRNLQPQLQHLQQQQPGVEPLLTYEDPQQSQQGPQGAQQFQVRNLQPQLQLPDLQQQPGAESLWTYEFPQQSQQGLQGAQQFQVRNLQPQLLDLQQQLGVESLSFDGFHVEFPRAISAHPTSP